jgi:hypothetical protein
MAVEITTVPKLGAGVPRLLFFGMTSSTMSRDPVRHQWAVTPDGKQFLIRVPGNAATARGGAGAPSVPFGTVGRGATPAATSAQQGFVSAGLTVVRNWPALFANKGK